LLLLQVSFGKVFELTLRELEVGRAGNSQLGAVTADDNIVGGKGSRLAIDLDAIVQVLLEKGHIEDFIVDGLCAVDNELDGRFLCLDLWSSNKEDSISTR
jgi:hypothetical protein